MSNAAYLRFPWLKFLFQSVFWAIVVMVILGVLFWIFGHQQFEEQFGITFVGSMLRNILADIAISLLVLVPCFYAGMGACVELEKRGGKYKDQFDAAFRVASLVAFFIIFLIWGAFALLPLDDMTIEDGFRAVRLLVIFYVFDANVIDGLWEDIFEKRE